MRPLRLSMTAFGPYAGTETVDFEALSDLGLFVVAGNNGSGKTTIFDALHYALFGTLPGRRATYIRLRSDHADPTVRCRVVFEFSAHGRRWRVERSPKQQRPKRRGIGMTEVDRRATLYEIVDGQPTAVANRIGEVDAKCRELVGLSGKQFERVALLPQGEFSRVLRESSTDRRELLRALFSSDVFGDATTLLADRAAAVAAADRAEADRIEHRLSTVTATLTELVGHPCVASIDALRTGAADFRTTRLAELARESRRLEHACEQATSAHRAAVEIERRIAQRDRVVAELDDHARNQAQHERDLERLAHARSAVPVASIARAALQQDERVETSLQAVVDRTARVNGALRTAGVGEVPQGDAVAVTATVATVASLVEILNRRQSAVRAATELGDDARRVQAELRRLDNRVSGRHEQQRTAQSRLRQLVAEQAELHGFADVSVHEREQARSAGDLARRRELQDLDYEQHAAHEAVAEIDQQLEHAQSAHDHALEARAVASERIQRADTLVAELSELERRLEAARRFDDTTGRLHRLRDRTRQARATADGLWDSFIAGTAARVAVALEDGEPCPVCGSPDHPVPASTPDSGPVITDTDVAAARERAESLDSQQRRLEDEIEALRAADADIAAIDSTQLAEAIRSATSQALAARDDADDVTRRAERLEPLAADLASLRDRLRVQRDTARSVDERRNRLVGALGAVADASLEHLQARAADAARRLTEAQAAAVRLVELAREIKALEATIETLATAAVDDDKQRASLAAQLTDRRLQRQRILDQLDALAAQLRATTPTAAAAPTDGGNDSDSRVGSGTRERLDAALDRRSEPVIEFDRTQFQAAQRALEQLHQLQTELALLRDARDGQRRAKAILAERLDQSPFATVEQALEAFLEPDVIAALEAQTTRYSTVADQLRGQLHAMAELPVTPPDISALEQAAQHGAARFEAVNRMLITTGVELDRIDSELDAIATRVAERAERDPEIRRIERVAALVKGDNDRNTSFENWVLGAHLRDVVELANIRLARSTQQRFQLVVLDDGENRRGTWGLDLGIEDTVTGTCRPTAGLSGGELFQASLALALGLADAVMNQTAGVRIDALFIDEGFGSLDDASVERAIDLLDELRERGAMVGVITHVPALREALPCGLTVVAAPDGRGSTIRQHRLAA